MQKVEGSSPLHPLDRKPRKCGPFVSSGVPRRSKRVRFVSGPSAGYRGALTRQTRCGRARGPLVPVRWNPHWPAVGSPRVSCRSREPLPCRVVAVCSAIRRWILVTKPCSRGLRVDLVRRGASTAGSPMGRSREERRRACTDRCRCTARRPIGLHRRLLVRYRSQAFLRASRRSGREACSGIREAERVAIRR